MAILESLYFYGSYIIPFVFVLSIVVFFHELGHFLVGRWCGVKVDVFSLGFGPELFAREDRHGTRWRVAAIPLGGYVKFLGDNDASSATPSEVPLSDDQKRRAFFTQPLHARAAVVLVAAISTGGSLFFSEVAHFPPCELCWYERICTYPVTAVALLAALASDFRVARYLLVLPFAGTCISVYHLLIENGVIGQSASCLVSAPGGCATRYISEFGFVTIPTLALTSSLLLLGLLGLASLNEKEAHHV